MKKVAVILILAFSFVALLPIKEIYARVIVREEGVVTIAEGEVVDDDLFVGAETAEIYGTVNGDVYVGSGSLRLDGNINGNLHIGSGMTTLSGDVSGSVYVGTGNLVVENVNIGNSLLIGAGNATIDSDTRIGGSLLVGSGSVVVNAPVGRNVFVAAGSIELNSQIGGEVRVAGGMINLGPDARVGGDLYYAVEEEEGSFNISDTASVAGQIKKSERFATEREIEAARRGLTSAFRAFNVVAKLISFLGALVVGVLSLKLFEKFFMTSASFVSKSFWKSVGAGFLIIIAAVPTFILLAITGVGFSLAWVLFLLLMLGIYFSKIVFALFVGSWLKLKLGWKDQSVYTLFAIGLFAIYILELIPVIGFFVTLLVVFSGLGALTLSFKLLTSAK